MSNIRTTALALTALAAASTAGARNIPVVVHVPADTPVAATVCLIGSLPGAGAWQGEGIQLTRAADSTYTGDLTLPDGQTLEYKFTRGSWDSVEKSADGSERSNRVLTVGASTLSIDATVERWANNVAPRTSSVVGTLRIMQVPATGPQAARTIRVWLPPGYDSAAPATRFPVLYLQDGQNCFDRATSAYGSEWQVDETLTQLIADGTVPPLVVVGVDNAGADRIKEYTFVPDPHDGGGDGAAYADWFLHRLLPFVEKTFRVATGPANTRIGGSSLGGLVSLEIARRNPGTFGGVLAMSPSLWWDGETFIHDLEKDTSGLAHTRVWLDIGTREVVALVAAGTPDTQNQRAVDEARRLDAVLRRNGIEERLTIDEGAQHNEGAWARRFPAAIAYLAGRSNLPSARP